MKRFILAVMIFVGMGIPARAASGLGHSVWNISRAPIVVRVEYQNGLCSGCWRGIIPMPPRPEGISEQVWEQDWRQDPDAIAWQDNWKKKIKAHWLNTGVFRTEAQANQELERNWSTGWAECRGPRGSTCQIQHIYVMNLNNRVLRHITVRNVSRNQLRRAGIVIGGVFMVAGVAAATVLTGGVAGAAIGATVTAGVGTAGTTAGAIGGAVVGGTAGAVGSGVGFSPVARRVFGNVSNEYVARGSTGWFYDGTTLGPVNGVEIYRRPDSQHPRQEEGFEELEETSEQKN